jgi:hypothetical protein
MRKLFIFLIAAACGATTLPLYIDTDTNTVVSPDAPTTVAGYGITDALQSSDIGVTVQAWNDGLDEISALPPDNGDFIVGKGSRWGAETGLTAQISMGIVGGFGQVQIGSGVSASGDLAVALGTGTDASGDNSVALGYYAESSATNSVQLGEGINSTASTIQFRDSGSVTAAEFGRIPQILTSVVRVSQASDLAGTLDSTKDYFIDGIIDMGSQSIEVPAGGLNLTGSTFDVSRLISSEPGYTMFTSPVGGSGNVLGRDLALEVTGAGSQVFNIVSATGFEAFEFARVNFNNCTSLGTIDNYRQGLETGTGRFGGTPNMTLKGTWSGGYFIDTSIVRSLDAGMTGALYQAGAGFTMASRFRSNQNIDLPANAAFIDFSPSNFANPSTVQLDSCIISRNGSFDSSDANITPNISKSDLASNWQDNVGIGNTFVGGRLTVASETTTTINTQSVFETLIATTWTATLLEHFDDLAVDTNGRGLRHLGNTPREYEISGDLVIDGNSNSELSVKVVKYDASLPGDVDIFTQTRQVNALVGGRDVAFFSIPATVELDQNDYIYLKVANNTGTQNVTLENDSKIIVRSR